MGETPQAGVKELEAQALEQTNMERAAQQQVEARVAALEPAVQPGETDQAALDRHRAVQMDAARRTISAIAQGNVVAAGNADFDRLAAEANANILSGSPDDPLTERPSLTQAEAAAMVQQQEAEALVAEPVPTPPAAVGATPAAEQPLAPVIDLTQRRAQPSTLEEHIRRSASNG